MTTEELRAAIEKRIEKEAENSINRNFFELHEADARVYKFKKGAYSMLNLILEMDEALEFYCSIEACQMMADSMRPRASVTIDDEKWNVKAKESRAKLAAWAKGE